MNHTVVPWSCQQPFKILQWYLLKYNILKDKFTWRQQQKKWEKKCQVWFPIEMFSVWHQTGRLYIPVFRRTSNSEQVINKVLVNETNWFLFQLVDVLSPGGVRVLTLQKSVELFELLHCLVFQVRVGDLQPNAVCRPRKLAWKHLGKDSCNNWNNLDKEKKKMAGFSRSSRCCLINQVYFAKAIYARFENRNILKEV